MMPTSIPSITTDVIIIGAGPAGLYAAFELGLHGLKTHIIDALPFAGGQCVELFGDKLIYDIPAIKKCTGIELTERLIEQLEPFNPTWHLGELVSELTHITPSLATESKPSTLFMLRTTSGLTLQAHSILVASGVGAFLPRKLSLENIESFENKQVFYQLPVELSALTGRHIVISGDLEETLQAANTLASQSDQRPASITLVHRRDKFRAQESTIALTQQLRQDKLLHFIAGQFTHIKTDTQTGALQALTIKQSLDETMQDIATDMLFVLHGLSPKLGPIANWGLALKGKQLIVDTSTYQTSVKGIYAIGDAVTYPGKKKLIVSTFHEATLASYGIASYLQGGAPIPLLYTSSSAELQALLKT